MYVTASDADLDGDGVPMEKMLSRWMLTMVGC